MVPEIAWVIAIHRKDVRDNLILDKAHSLVDTAIIVKTEIVSKPNRGHLHYLLLQQAQVRLQKR